MRSELERVSVSKVVTDVYGRELGKLVGVVLDFDGSISSIGVNEGGGRFVQYPKERTLRNERGYQVLPDWKVELQTLMKESEATKRRELALEEISKDMSSNPKILDELRRHLKDVRASHAQLREKLQSRLSELGRTSEDRANFEAMTKIQRVTSEIDESAYRAANEYIQSAVSADTNEKDEIRRAIGFIENIEQPVAQAPTEPKPAWPTRPVIAPARDTSLDPISPYRQVSSSARQASTSTPRALPPQIREAAPIAATDPFPQFKLSPSAFRMPEPSDN
jgi:CdvA-like coiled-coil domain